MYVKYPYVPGPGFYGTGLAGILGNSTAAMTAAWRISLDTGMFASFPAFLMDKLAGRQNTSDFRLSPGTATGVETGGRNINEVITALPYKDVLPGLMSLVDKITQQGKEVGGAPDIPVGEGMQNVPVGTMLSHIEQATKVMAAAHKGQHRAMDEELSLIIDLFRENPESFWKGNKAAKGIWTAEKLFAAMETHALVPKSDPNVPSHIHRLMRATALAELAATKIGEATLDPFETMRRILVAMREEPMGLMKQPNPNEKPSPEQITAEAKAEEAKTKAAKLGVDLQIAQAKMPVEKMKTEAMIKGKELELARTLAANEDEQKRAEVEGQIAQGEFQLKGQELASENWKRQQDVGIERERLGIEREKVGLGHREADLAEQQHATEASLGAAELEHQVGIDHQKVGIDGQKVGVAQHQAETQRHTAMHPPKPAGGGSKKKGK
jgi:hypothetical protein